MRAETVLLMSVLVSVGVLAGCDSPPYGPAADAVDTSSHTVGELCNYPKAFFAERFAVAELRAEATASKPLAAPIGSVGGCSYYSPTADSRGYLGYVALRHESVPAEPPSDAVSPRRTVTAGGIAVTEAVKAVPAYQDAATAKPAYVLTATVDGWHGELGFEAGDDKGTRAGAQVLVAMIRALGS